MSNIENNLVRVRHSIAQSALDAGRNSNTITLLAVSKTKPAEDIEAAVKAGQFDFGENYLQESLVKMAQLQSHPIIWHYIGAIQANKARVIAENYAWVHTVDRIKVAERLSCYRPSNMLPLNICLQVNIDGEGSKSGCQVGELEALVKAVTELPNLHLRGLMAIPRPGSGAEPFRRLAQLRETINKTLDIPLDSLSMGMSQDLEQAILAGSTIVRVGTAIFGPRAQVM